jgi:hypothetical protein
MMKNCFRPKWRLIKWFPGLVLDRVPEGLVILRVLLYHLVPGRLDEEDAEQLEKVKKLDRFKNDC